MHPAVPILVRRVMAPCAVGGHHLTPGSFVVPCVYIVHHRSEIFPDPLRFRPERFLERGYGPHEFVPFGGGNRRFGQSAGCDQPSENNGGSRTDPQLRARRCRC